MHSHLVSIIIPIYNTEEYLVRCLESVINQTYQNLEIILVNDGSTDDSLSICNKYKQTDKRIILLNKQNSGQALARNSALEIVKGDYVTFIDSDDWVSLDYIEALYSNLKKYDADISISATMLCNSKDIFVSDYDNVDIFDNNYQVIKAFLTRRLSSMTCGSLIKSQIINDLRFRHFIAYEDLDFFYKIYAKAQVVVKSYKVRYFYYQRNDSVMGNNRLNFSDEHLACLKKISADYEIYFVKNHPMFGGDIYMYILGHIINNYMKELTGKNELSKGILKLYRKLYTNCRNSNYDLMLRYRVFFLFPRLATWSYLLVKKIFKNSESRKKSQE